MQNLTPLKAIKLNCFDCSGGNYSQVRNCQIDTCPLYQFRQGKNPKRTRKDRAKG